LPNAPHIRSVIKTTKKQAQITKRVYPYLLGMPSEQIQKFLGRSKLETTQLYAESSTEILRESYQRALSR
jgi:site-specific recombinase XerD